MYDKCAYFFRLSGHTERRWHSLISSFHLPRGTTMYVKPLVTNEKWVQTPGENTRRKYQCLSTIRNLADLGEKAVEFPEVLLSYFPHKGEGISEITFNYRTYSAWFGPGVQSWNGGKLLTISTSPEGCLVCVCVCVCMCLCVSHSLRISWCGKALHLVPSTQPLRFLN